VTCYEQLNYLSDFKEIQYLSPSQNIAKQAKLHDRESQIGTFERKRKGLSGFFFLGPIGH